MEIRDFTVGHAREASRIAGKNYDEERGYVPALPFMSEVPDLSGFAENGMGVAAFEDDIMVGFLCALSPFPNAFHSTKATGVFSPMHANGTVKEKRGEIYGRMYQAAGEKWARAGASSHAVCLYAHDEIAQQQFFQYGFGMRCIDGIRDLRDIEAPPCENVRFYELEREEYVKVLPLDHLLDAHMAKSPTFILRASACESSFMEDAIAQGARYFGAAAGSRLIAFMKVHRGGETFICDAPDYLHVQGAYCLPEYRGKGIYQNLLKFATQILYQEGTTRLGVDFESINPAAHRFWLKHFSEYARGVVRRIDENCMMG